MTTTNPIQEISIINNLIRRELELFASEHNVSGAAVKVLNFLTTTTQKNVCQRDVEEVLGIRASTATVLLQRMAANGLITREPLARDRRRQRIVLTDAARAVQTDVADELSGLNSAIMAGVSPEDAATFMAVMTKIKNNLAN